MIKNFISVYFSLWHAKWIPYDQRFYCLNKSPTFGWLWLPMMPCGMKNPKAWPKYPDLLLMLLSYIPLPSSLLEGIFLSGLWNTSLLIVLAFKSFFAFVVCICFTVFLFLFLPCIYLYFCKFFYFD